VDKANMVLADRCRWTCETATRLLSGLVDRKLLINGRPWQGVKAAAAL
jgi:hypothetical protein